MSARGPATAALSIKPADVFADELKNLDVTVLEYVIPLAITL